MTYDDPIAALATPLGRSALAVVRCSGEGCIELMATAFSRPEALREAAGHTVVYGRLLNHGREGQAELVDELTAVVFRAPRSYTGEDVIELVCHGSPKTVESVLGLLRRLGFRPAEPGEFTLRAFLAGKIDLTQAEAVAELIDARTHRARSLALRRLSGSVAERINAVKARLVEISAAVEIHLDYPEEDSSEVAPPVQALAAAIADLERLVATYATGKRLRDGAPVAIAGRTNAGKSSLFNVLLREDRSIVSELHGTTRDYIEQGIEIDGIPVTLYDTAGLREPGGAIESEGIRRSEVIMANAAAVVYLVDGAEPPSEPNWRQELEAVRARSGGGVIAVWHKIDRAGAGVPPGFIGVSSVSGEGLDVLRNALRRVILPASTAESEAAVIESDRQKQLIDRAVEALRRVREGLAEQVPLDLVAVDLQEALSALGEITGEVSSAELLDVMFSKFCVGK